MVLDKSIFTIEEAANYLDTSIDTLLRWESKYGLKILRIGRKRFIYLKELIRFIDTMDGAGVAI